MTLNPLAEGQRSTHSKRSTVFGTKGYLLLPWHITEFVLLFYSFLVDSILEHNKS